MTEIKNCHVCVLSECVCVCLESSFVSGKLSPDVLKHILALYEIPMRVVVRAGVSRSAISSSIVLRVCRGVRCSFAGGVMKLTFDVLWMMEVGMEVTTVSNMVLEAHLECNVHCAWLKCLTD